MVAMMGVALARTVTLMMGHALRSFYASSATSWQALVLTSFMRMTTPCGKHVWIRIKVGMQLALIPCLATSRQVMLMPCAVARGAKLKPSSECTPMSMTNASRRC